MRVLITGGAGFLGIQHAEAIAEAGGIPILWDIKGKEAEKKAFKIAKKFNVCQMTVSLIKRGKVWKHI